MSDGEQADSSQKTEDPTPKRLEEARKKGQVPISREVNNWVMMLAATVLIAGFGVTFLSRMNEILLAYLQRAGDWPSAPGGLAIFLDDGFEKVLMIMMLPMLVQLGYLQDLVQFGIKEFNL